jgi:GTP-binding protein HflX
VRLPGIDKAILSDTVGFISDLPTQLVAAFRATLEEVTSADVILHVRDIAQPDSDGQKTQVLRILEELELIGEGGGEPRIPIVEIWNKWDLLDPARADDLKQVVIQRSDEIIVPISALTGEGCNHLLEVIGRLLTANARLHEFVLPVRAGKQLAWLHAHGDVVSEDEAGEGDDGPERRLKVMLTPRDLGRFSRL